jgi:hypothetical protein
MPLDPEIALHAGDALGQVQQGNPLLPQNYGQLVGVANAARELQAAQVYQGATGPDGQVDTNKLIAGFGQGPASFMAGPLIQQALANQGAQLQQANFRRGVYQNAASSLLQDKDLSLDKITGKMSELVQQGLMSPQAMMQEGKAFIGPNGEFDQKAARLRITEHLINTLEPQQRVEALYGRPVVIGTGDGSMVGTFGGVNGFQELASVKSAPSPEALMAQPQGGVLPSGAPTLSSGKARAQELGIGPSSVQSQGGLAVGGGPGATKRQDQPSAAASLGSGRYAGAWDLDSIKKLSPEQYQKWKSTASETQLEMLRKEVQRRLGGAGAAQPQ